MFLYRGFSCFWWEEQGKVCLLHLFRSSFSHSLFFLSFEGSTSCFNCRIVLYFLSLPYVYYFSRQWKARLIINLKEFQKKCTYVVENIPFDFIHLLLFSHSLMSDLLQPHGLQHTMLPCPLPFPRVRSNSCPLSQWCYPTILSSVVPFSSCLHSFPASGSSPVNWLSASGGQRNGASASASVLSMNIHGWLPLGLTSLISLLSKGFSRVLSSTTVWKHQFFGAQPSLWSNSHIHTWLLEKP